MSGAMRRIGEYLGLLEDTGRYDDDYAELDDPRYDDTYEGHRYAEETTPVAAERMSRREAREARQAATVAHLDDRRRGGAPTMTAAPRVAELSRITTLHPRTYNEALRVVVVHLREVHDHRGAVAVVLADGAGLVVGCLLYTSPSPRDGLLSRMPSSA